MKKAVIIFSFMCLGFWIHAQEEQVKTAPAVKFEEKIFEFGVIKQGDIVEHTFVFENMGTEPIKILSARGSCGCTVPKYSKEEVKPGEKGEVFVKFNSAGKMGNQNKTVTLVTNAPTEKTIVLTVRGRVEKRDTME